jgi:hypothetical protein
MTGRGAGHTAGASPGFFAKRQTGAAKPEEERRSNMIVITIKTDNAAFTAYDGSPDPYICGDETARILEELAENMRDCGPQPIPLRDYNGNKVGQVEVSDD